MPTHVQSSRALAHPRACRPRPADGALLCRVVTQLDRGPAGDRVRRLTGMINAGSRKAEDEAVLQAKFDRAAGPSAATVSVIDKADAGKAAGLNPRAA